MATRYKKYADDPETGPLQCIQKIEDNGLVSCIPFAPLNTDYKEYLEWVAEGNTAEDAG